MPYFDTASITKAVAEVVAQSDIPKDHTHVFALVATMSGVKGVVSIKVNDIWKIDSIVTVDYTGKFDGGLALKGSW